MNSAQARQLIKETFTQAFDKARFGNLAVNLLNRIDDSKAFARNNQYIKDAFKDHVDCFERLGTYTSPDNEKIDVLIVHLTKIAKIERARTAIRNFVADHLKERDGKEAALVAFVSPTEKQWRFSYVKMEYATVEKDSGKVGVETRLTPARRFSYLVGEGESCHTAQNRFLTLLQDTATDPTLTQIEDAFSVEAVTKEFFGKYAELFGEINTALEKLVAKDKTLRDEFKAKGVNTVDFAKKLIGQIVFLYFLQKKGWLGVEKGKDWGTGPRDFLRRLAKGEYGKYDNFFNDVLEPLFYDTLATDRGHEAWCNRFKCRIPFLNAGLFEPLGDYAWKKTDIILPNKLFTNSEFVEEGITGTGVLDVFDRYNFTVNEAEPLEKEVAIDPEMLGKVFENLIEDNRRKGLGSYYTPREIVHYMCQESLINYLYNALNMDKVLVSRTDIETLIHLGEQISHYESVEAQYAIKMPKCIQQNARPLDDALKVITVCDPAVGSGAFPVGMMTEIVRARGALTPYFVKEITDDKQLAEAERSKRLDKLIEKRSVYSLKKHAIQNCLYGVDIDASAVEIAKLRLWLSLVVDEEDVKHIKPLPNLDYKIVAGNSLLGIDRDDLQNWKILNKLDRLKPLFFNETDKSKKAEFKTEIDRLLHELTRGKAAFDLEIYFSEVFQQGHKFDVIIANPPYVKEYTQRSAFDGVRDSLYFQGKMDLWYFFACKSLDLLKAESGVLCFIATNNWITNAGASTLRSKIVSEATILKLLDFGEYKIFETADIQTMVLVCLKTSAKPRYKFDLRRINNPGATLVDVIDLLNKVENIKVSFLNPEFDRLHLKGKPLTFSDDSTERVLAKMLSQRNFSLDGVREIAQGIVAPQDFVNRASKEVLGDGCEVGDGIFVLSTPEKTANKFTSEELEIIKPYYTTSELLKYFGKRRNSLWIIYTDSSYKTPSAIKPYPNMKKHLDRFKSVITSDNHPYGLHRSRNEQFFKGEKIISVRKCAEPTFTFVDFDCYVSQTFNVIKSNRLNMKYLTGVLNSRAVAFWLKHRGKMQGHQFQIDKEPLLAIPLVLGGKAQQASVITLVDRILAAKRQDPGSDTTALEREIDQLVYKLYGLTPEEIKVVEEVKWK